MFEKIKYKIKTKGYFNPELNAGKPRVDISREDFLQILSGDIVNPDRLISPKMQTDYSFMLVGTPIGAPLNSWAGQKWGVDSFDNVQLYSDWYAKIYCENNDSYVVFPNQSLFFHFDPRSEYNCG